LIARDATTAQAEQQQKWISQQWMQQAAGGVPQVNMTC